MVSPRRCDQNKRTQRKLLRMHKNMAGVREDPADDFGEIGDSEACTGIQTTKGGRRKPLHAKRKVEYIEDYALLRFELRSMPVHGESITTNTISRPILQTVGITE